ncbi:hypothetical protein MVEN_01012700 [Mycena venus]|uniref:Uncharacterized protein n=1 Tax=Mycena venus TaxID=2733690 RepID=A0A8H6YDL6_9AGAR|nr:hypothetical protein MVEN_01012700 [Mycena venus]
MCPSILQHCHRFFALAALIGHIKTDRLYLCSQGVLGVVARTAGIGIPQCRNRPDTYQALVDLLGPRRDEGIGDGGLLLEPFIHLVLHYL